MTLAMLASYPDVFAAGAVIAGLPYGRATNAQEALRGMFQAPPKSSRELGDLVREASPDRIGLVKVVLFGTAAGTEQ